MKLADEKKVVLVVFTLAVGVLLFVGGLSYKTTTRFFEITELRNNAHDTIEELQSLLSELQDAETGERGYVITGEESYLEPYRDSRQAVMRTLERLEKLAKPHPEQAQDLNALKRATTRKFAGLERKIATRKEGGFDAARSLVLKGTGKQEMDEIRNIIADMVSREDQLMARWDAEIATDARASVITQLVGTLVGCGMLLAVFVMLTQEITQRKQAESDSNALARQQGAVAQLGQLALSGVDLGRLMDEAVSVVAQILEVEYCKILELLPDGRGLLLRAGVGWKQGIAGRAIVPADAGSQAGYTLLSQEPVVVEDLRTESRFAGPPLLLDHNVVSGLSVIIPARDRPFGILGAHTISKRTFDRDSVNFLQTVANALATAIERKLAEEEMARQAQILSQIHDAVVATDLDGHVTSWNQGAVRLFGYSPEEAVGKHISFVYPEDEQQFLDEMVIQPLKEQGAYETEVQMRRKSGDRFHAHLSLSMLRDTQGKATGMIGYSLDITARKQAEQVSRGQTEVLVHSLDALTTNPDLDSFLGEVLIAVTQVFNVHSSALWLYSAGKDSLELHLTARADGVFRGDQQLDHPYATRPLHILKGSPLESLLASHEPFVIENPAHSSLLEADLRTWAVGQGLRSELGVPLLFGADPIGLMTVRDTRRDTFTAQEKSLAQALAHQVALGLQLTRLADRGEQSAVLQERNRVAREIHDTLAQGLTGIVVQLEAAEDVFKEDAEGAHAHVTRARGLARESLAEARRSVWALRPQALEGGDLNGALRRLGQQLTDGTSTVVEYSLRGTPRRLSPEIEVHLLRIGQEAMTNALRHAQASKVQVELAFDAQGVQLSVQDNGQGFDPRKQNIDRGFGLIGLHERAERMGAQLTVYSEPGLGTRVVAQVPVEAQNSDGVIL